MPSLPSPELNKAADDEEQTNDYQILFKRFKTAPFTIEQGKRAFKQGSPEATLKVLVALEKERLAQRLDEVGWNWIMLEVR